MGKGNQLIHSFNHSENYQGNFEGLTKREYFAGLAMQGLLTRTDGNPVVGISESERIVSESVIMADKLLKQLEEKQS